jgi:phage terminase small subunit
VPGTSSSGGRNKKSRAEHALAGTGRKDRGTKATAGAPVDAPDPPLGRPPMPIGLIGPALEEWTRMVLRLEQAKTLSTVDDAALYQYCCLFAETEAIVVAQRGTVALLVPLVAALERWNRLVDRLEKAELAQTVTDEALVQSILDRAKYGVQIVAATAQIVQLKKLEAKYPSQLRMGHMALRQYLVEFGMTPAARSRVTELAGGKGDAPADPFDEFDEPAGKKH